MTNISKSLLSLLYKTSQSRKTGIKMMNNPSNARAIIKASPKFNLKGTIQTVKIEGKTYTVKELG